MLPRVCTIAGSDSSGGSGIQADLKTFQRFGVHGLCVLTAVTAQRAGGVDAVYPMPSEFVARQLQSVLTDLGEGGVKTGMLVGSKTIRSVIDILSNSKIRHLVVDPVILASDGHTLLDDLSVGNLMTELFPIAEIITPNIAEAERLSGCSIDSVSDMERAARKIHQAGCGSVLVKGGHLEGDAIDILYDGHTIQAFKSHRIPGPSPRGTGCALSAAILSGLVLGLSVLEAVKRAKAYIELAIRQADDAGNGVRFLNHQVSLEWVSQ